MTKILKIKKTPVITDEYVEDKYPYFIRDFIKTMDNYNLSIFYHNIKDIRLVATSKKNMKNKNAGAEYDIYSNTIHYTPSRVKADIMHELLHAATRVELEDGRIAGFMQVLNNGIGIGLGINEGYTALMDDRYFIDYDEEKKNEVDYVYPTSKYICALLDYLLGQEHMEELYMNADLLTLFKELSEYSSPRKTYNFLIRFDNLHMEADKNMHPNFLKVNKLYEEIIFYLAECFLTKYKYMYINKEITDEEYEKSLAFIEFFMDQTLTYYKILKSRKMSKYLPTLQEKVDIKIKKKTLE